jgi:hypothetical protein
MAETLLSISTVLLYGRIVTDLSINHTRSSTTPIPDDVDSSNLPRLGRNNFLDHQLSADQNKPDKKPYVARIYGFSFEGHYYDLPKPSLFVVHGKGTLAEGPVPGISSVEQRYSRAPGSAERTGMGSQAGSFAGDIYAWSYDKGDFSVRLDPSTGTLEQILLDAELSGDRLKTQIGAAAMMRMRATRGGGATD